MRAGQNPVDILCNLPSVAPAGSFFVTDPLGRSPYGYCCFGQSLFYEVNLYNGALRRLANLPAGVVFGPGLCATLNSGNGRVWIVGPGLGAGDDSYTGYYNPLTDAWVAADAANSLDALLGATWGTEGTLVHLGPAMSGAYTGDVMILRGGNLNTCYLFSIAGDAWAATGVPGAVAGPGATMAVAWAHNDDRVYASLGAGVAPMAYYSIAGGNWPVFVGGPSFGDGPNTGASACTHPAGRRILYRINATGQIVSYDPVSNALTAYARIYGPDGTATVGNKMCAYVQGGDTYVCVIVHGSSQVQRIRIVE